ncbi:hypothetical protein ACH5RR_006898 [Cinchona calisaya]|uniref:RNase H type-1 domain-containing protein n=1 Tax=Cinchona calisaya TaxID=153742 RepID=A0ABD3AQ87_9GENT
MEQILMMCSQWGDGVLARDHAGSYLKVWCPRMEKLQCLAEILAAKEAASLAKTYPNKMIIKGDANKVNIEGVAAQVIKFLSDEGDDLSEFGHMLDEIRYLRF